MNEKMTFSDLIDKIHEETGESKKVIHQLLTYTVDVIKEGVNNDKNAIIKGLGSFQLKKDKARKSRNPQTGEEIDVPASNSLIFKPELKVREHINRRYAHLKTIPIPDKKTHIIEEKPAQIIEKKPVQVPFQEKKEPLLHPYSIFEQEEKKEKKSPWWWIIAIFILIAAAIIIILLRTESTEEREVEKAVVVLEDAVQELAKPAVTPNSYPLVDRNYIAQKGDKLWEISRQYYGDYGYLWPNIYRVNYNIKNPDIVAVGRKIIIPELEGTPENPTQKDVENIAEGFILAYIAYKDVDRKGAEYYLWALKGLNGAEAIIEKYKDRIDSEDLESIRKFKFVPKTKI